MFSVIVHYAELALKGKNRPWFIHTLVRNIRHAVADLDVVRVRPLMGRIEAKFGPAADWEEVRERLSGLPGIGNFSKATHVEPDLEAITKGIVAALPGRTAKSFRIAARRADKRFPIPSPDIERAVGRAVQDVTGWPVDLSNPDLVIRIEMVTSDAFFFFGKERGPGGLPVGTSGRVHVPALGRHRFAGRRLAADAARLPRDVRALSQRADSLAHVAGQGAHDRRDADAPSAVHRVCTSCRSRRSSRRSSSACRRTCASSSTGG